MVSFLVTVMGLAVPWSTTLALVDTYCVFVNFPARQVRIMMLVVVGDWVRAKVLSHTSPELLQIRVKATTCTKIHAKQVLSLLSLAAATSTACVAQFLLATGEVYPAYRPACARYPLSATMAFLSWFLSLASFLFNIWVLPAL